ncbi:YceK/YidQ family lipoprotein [Pseudomonas fluorescens]|jgi:uncharacterized protein YceK|uniref:YceK/YidQ family lipoprotein n=1 Tax=Pseudomonas fluorescens TaxID=294 RepID=UPI0007D081E6|nr:YceK/YidQ family lipoprotein [Pseudomonas fluorescens]
MKVQAVMLAALMLAGCGTVQTVVRSDQAAADGLKKQKSYCGAVPRVYSGLMYDFCSLHAPLEEGKSADDYNTAVPGLLVDALVSGALDTLLLPYTVYRQSTDGSIVVN